MRCRTDPFQAEAHDHCGCALALAVVRMLPSVLIRSSMCVRRRLCAAVVSMLLLIVLRPYVAFICCSVAALCVVRRHRAPHQTQFQFATFGSLSSCRLPFVTSAVDVMILLISVLYLGYPAIFGFVPLIVLICLLCPFTSCQSSTSCAPTVARDHGVMKASTVALMVGCSCH